MPLDGFVHVRRLARHDGIDAARDYFEIIVRQTSGSTKNVAADELTWFAVEPTSTE